LEGSDWVLSSLFDAKSALALALALTPVPILAFGENEMMKAWREKRAD